MVECWYSGLWLAVFKKFCQMVFATFNTVLRQLQSSFLFFDKGLGSYNYFLYFWQQTEGATSDISEFWQRIKELQVYFVTFNRKSRELQWKNLNSDQKRQFLPVFHFLNQSNPYTCHFYVKIIYNVQQKNHTFLLCLYLYLYKYGNCNNFS